MISPSFSSGRHKTDTKFLPILSKFIFCSFEPLFQKSLFQKLAYKLLEATQDVFEDVVFFSLRTHFACYDWMRKESLNIYRLPIDLGVFLSLLSCGPFLLILDRKQQFDCKIGCKIGEPKITQGYSNNNLSSSGCLEETQQSEGKMIVMMRQEILSLMFSLKRQLKRSSSSWLELNDFLSAKVFFSTRNWVTHRETQSATLLAKRLPFSYVSITRLDCRDRQTNEKRWTRESFASRSPSSWQQGFPTEKRKLRKKRSTSMPRQDQRWHEYKFSVCLPTFEGGIRVTVYDPFREILERPSRSGSFFFEGCRRSHYMMRAIFRLGSFLVT